MLNLKIIKKYYLLHPQILALVTVLKKLFGFIL